MFWTISWFDTHIHNFTNSIHFIKNGTSCIRFSCSLPTTSSTNFLIDDSYPTTMDYICSDCLYIIINVTWYSNVWWFWRSFRHTWLLMCPNTYYAALRNGLHDGNRNLTCPTSLKVCCISQGMWNGALSIRMDLCISRIWMTLVWINSKNLSIVHARSVILCAMITSPPSASNKDT